MAQDINKNQTCLIELDFEKENDSEDTKEAKEKLFVSTLKAFYCLNNIKVNLINKYDGSCNLFISSGYSKPIYSPPWLV